MVNMKYENIIEGRFVSRPNRFIAIVNIKGENQVCHVKNTGRCKELLTDDARVILEKSSNPNRKTAYDLVAVYKNGMLINMDSFAPNLAFGQWAAKSGFFGDCPVVKPEKTYKNSRFDFYIESDARKIFVEVKGVTLEREGVVMFPDAPTERGAKHLNELADAVKNGYEAYVFFVAQMDDCKYFTPNEATDMRFANALRRAKSEGVNVVCMNCLVAENGMELNDFVPVFL